MSRVMLSFDIEEFDMPLEYGKFLSLKDQIDISARGTTIVLDILKKYQIQATFFSTVVFASHVSDLIRRIIEEGHELGSHGYFHSKFEETHLLTSKIELEKLSNQKIEGFRMARMKPVKNEAIEFAGYLYNSSLNPVYLPGRYNNILKPRTVYRTRSLIQLPASATPIIRIPLFWLSFHNFPLWFYKLLCNFTLAKDDYLNVYFHPWEFTDLKKDIYGLPGYVTKNSGQQMIERFNSLIEWMKKKNYVFCSLKEFINQRNDRS
jgi:peptidoglycan/xylan/chitin deacetylase (PgdA/CDA1 family)